MQSYSHFVVYISKKKKKIPSQISRALNRSVFAIAIGGSLKRRLLDNKWCGRRPQNSRKYPLSATHSFFQEDFFFFSSFFQKI